MHFFRFFKAITIALIFTVFFNLPAEARQCSEGFFTKANLVVESFFDSNRLARYSGARLGFTVAPRLWASLDAESKINLVDAVSCAIGGVGNITLVTLHDRTNGRKIAEMTRKGPRLF